MGGYEASFSIKVRRGPRDLLKIHDLILQTQIAEPRNIIYSAAIDEHCRSMNKATHSTGEEQDGVSDLLRVANSAETRRLLRGDPGTGHFGESSL
jgi:hypothetical protein